MTTLTLNPTNFGKKIWSIYTNVINYWEIKIQIIKPINKKNIFLKWTQKEEKAYKNAMEDYKESKNIIDWNELFNKLWV